MPFTSLSKWATATIVNISIAIFDPVLITSHLDKPVRKHNPCHLRFICCFQNTQTQRMQVAVPGVEQGMELVDFLLFRDHGSGSSRCLCISVVYPVAGDDDHLADVGCLFP